MPPSFSSSIQYDKKIINLDPETQGSITVGDETRITYQRPRTYIDDIPSDQEDKTPSANSVRRSKVVVSNASICSFYDGEKWHRLLPGVYDYQVDNRGHGTVVGQEDDMDVSYRPDPRSAGDSNLTHGDEWGGAEPDPIYKGVYTNLREDVENTMYERRREISNAKSALGSEGERDNPKPGTSGIPTIRVETVDGHCETL